MAGAVSKDSLAKCDQPSMLYDAVRYQSAPYVPPKPRIDSADSSKDTLESTQQRLNREMLDKFQNTSSRMSHHSYIAAAQTGKYLFLAIMLPPYLCCYGIPKWIMVTLLPQVFSMSKAQTMRVGRFIAEFSARVADLMKGALEQMLGDALRASRRQAKAFKDFFKNFARKQAARLASMKERAGNFKRDLHKGIYDAFIKGRNALRSWLESHALHIIEKIVYFVKKILSIIFFPFDLCDRFILTPVVSWLKAKAASLLSLTKFVLNKVAAKADRIKKWLYLKLQPVVDFVGRQISKMRLAVGRWWSSVLHKLTPVFLWIQAKTSIAAAYALSAFRAFGRFIWKPIKIVAQKLQWPLRISIGWAKSLLTRVGAKFKFRISSPWKALAKMRADRTAKKRAKRAESLRRLANAFKWSLRGIGTLFAMLSKGFVNFCSAMWAMFVWWFRQLTAFPAKCVVLLVNAFWLIVKGIQKCIYATRVALAWSIAFYQLGMVQVREFSAFLHKV